MKELDESTIEINGIDGEQGIDVPNEHAAEMLDEIKVFQGEAKKNMASLISKHFEMGNIISKDVREALINLKKENEKENSPVAGKLIKDIEKFIKDAEDLPTALDDDEAREEIFQDFRNVYIGLKKIDDSGDFGDYSKALEDFDTVHKESFESFERNRFAPNKYIAQNTGDFNMSDGEDLALGVAKVVATYNWMKTNGMRKLSDETFGNDAPFPVNKIEKNARKLLKDTVFQSQYMTEVNGKKVWDVKKLETAVKTNAEWKTFNVIQKDIEEKKKKKAEQDAIAKQIQDNKKEEFAEAAKKSAKQIMDNLNEVVPENENEVVEEDFVENLATNSIDITGVDKKGKAAPAKKKEPQEKVSAHYYVDDRYLAERRHENSLRSNAENVEKKYEDASEPEKAAINGMALIETFKNMSKELKDFKEEFLQAQINHQANNDGGLTEEGPKDYVNIMKQLNLVTQMIDNTNDRVVLKTIAKETTKLFKMVKTYEKEHKPRVRGHRTPESAKRYEIMGRVSDKGTAYTNAINNLASEMTKHVKKAGAGELPYDKTAFHTLGDQLKEMYLIKDMKPLEKAAKPISANQVYAEEKKVYVNKIIKGLKDHTDGFDIDGCYNSMEEREYYYNGGAERNMKHPINVTVASAFDLAQAAIVERELRKLKTAETTLSELKALDKKIQNGGFKKEAFDVSGNPGFHLDMDVAKITGIKGNDLLVVANQIVTGVEDSIKHIKWVATAFDKMSQEELSEKTTFLDPNNKANKLTAKLIYNITTAKVLAQPDNIDIYYNLISPKNPYNYYKNADASAKAIQNTMFDYIHKTIIDPLKGANNISKDDCLTMDYYSKVMKMINDPKYIKGFTKAYRKASEREYDRNKSYVRSGAEQRMKNLREEEKSAKRYAKQQERERKAREKELKEEEAKEKAEALKKKNSGPKRGR